MITITGNQTITFYPNRAAAEKIAAANQAFDDEWTYEVTESNGRFFITLKDENGTAIGTI